jgi:hypothetical protein
MGNIDVDGAALLRAIIENQSTFPDISAEINKVAQNLVATQLKATSMDLDRAKEIYRAIGDRSLALVLEGLTDASAKSLTKKLDPNYTELAKQPPHWQRGHILKLARGETAQAAKSEATKGTGPRKSANNRKPPLGSQETEAKKKLNDKSITLANARALHQEIGESSFKNVLNTMTATMIAKLAKKLDKSHPELGTASPEWLRDHITSLAAGIAEPRSILHSEAMSATRLKPPAPKATRASAKT